MKRKIILATVLCLAVAALGSGAAPALAQEGCTCHTSVPPATGAPAAHTPLDAGITDCTVCHQGMATQPHPEVLEAIVYVSGSRHSGLAFKLGGGLYLPWHPLAGVQVIVQRKADDAGEFATIGAPLTDALGFFHQGLGIFNHSGTFRAISQGLPGPPVVKPAIAVQYTEPPDLPTPGLTLAFTGLSDGVVKLGRSVIAGGTVTPVDMAGQKVRLLLQKRIVRRGNASWSPRWNGVYHDPVTRIIRADGTYRWKITARVAGKYRVRATTQETAAFHRVITEWKVFRVK